MHMGPKLLDSKGQPNRPKPERSHYSILALFWGNNGLFLILILISNLNWAPRPLLDLSIWLCWTKKLPNFQTFFGFGNFLIQQLLFKVIFHLKFEI